VRSSRPRAWSSRAKLVTAVCRMAFFKNPDGKGLIVHRRFDA
jgi:hypothetical protein